MTASPAPTLHVTAPSSLADAAPASPTSGSAHSPATPGRGPRGPRVPRNPRRPQRTLLRRSLAALAAVGLLGAATSCADATNGSLGSSAPGSSTAGSTDAAARNSATTPMPASEKPDLGRIVAALGAVPQLSATVVAEHPFDSSSFLQGLEVMPGTSGPTTELLVGTGMKGESQIYRRTLGGERLASVDLPASDFGEGATVVRDEAGAAQTVWQLTWKNQVAYQRDPQTLEEVGQARYEGEGWGLCYQPGQPGAEGQPAQPGRLVMTNGSNELTFRDPQTFAVTGTVPVTVDGVAIENLNEVDCAADGSVWANIWQTNSIVRIDPATGAVTGHLDTRGMFPAATERGADVLNGLAQLPDAPNRWYVGGKRWGTLYEVEIAEPNAGA